jgi:hypothetical protein
MRAMTIMPITGRKMIQLNKFRFKPFTSAE